MSLDRIMRSRMEPTDELGQDPELASVLDLLDPAHGDPGYWMRFRGRVLRAAAPELARRRLVADVSMPEVVMSWARTVVPAAVLAAALAGVFLLKDRPPVTQPSSASVEELLAAGVKGSTIPAELASTQIAFASESF
jgi:hypothetical protein